MSEEEETSPQPPEGYEELDLGPSEENLGKAENAWYSEDESDYDWITRTDTEILEVLLVSGLTLTPAIIAQYIDRSRAGVSKRLSSLQAGGLVEKEGRGKYSISLLGMGYVIAGPSPKE